MTQPIPCNPEDLQVSSAALLAYLTTNSSVACRQLMELGGPNIILALIPHNLTQSSDGSKSPVAIPFYPSDGSEPPVIHDAEDLTPLVLSNVTYLLPQGPPTPKPSVDALQTHLLDCLSSLVSSTCNLPAFSAQGWTSVPNHKSDLDGSETSAPLTSPVPLLLGLLDLRVVPPPPAPLPTTPSAAAPKSAGKGTKGGAAPPVAEAPPPPPPPEPFPPSVRASALRCLAQLARISAHAAEISSSMAFRNLVLSSDGETYSPVADMGVVEAVALLLHSLLSFTPGVLGEQEAVHCLKRLAQSIVAAPTEGYAGLGSVQAAKSGVLRAILALPDQGEAVFVAPPRPPPPSPPKSPPPPPLATSQFIWDALGKPEMTDGFKLAAS